MSGDDGEQRTLDGETVEDDEDEEQTNDFGEEMPWYECKSGRRRDVVVSTLQKSIRRGDEETAALCAFELVRSGPGYETHYWNRVVLVTLEDLVAGNEAVEHVLRYRDLADSEFADNEWARRLCAIAAALVCARAQSSREVVHANGYFSNTMKDRARAKQEDGHEPLYDPPVTDEELNPDGKIGSVAVDKHVYTNPGRGWPHFRIHGARIGPEPETDLGEKWWRRVLEYDHPDYAYREPEEAFTEEEIELATTPVDESDPWADPREDAELGEFEENGTPE